MIANHSLTAINLSSLLLHLYINGVFFSFKRDIAFGHKPMIASEIS